MIIGNLRNWRLLIYLFAVMSMALPQTVNATGVDNSSNYRVTPKGVREITISCPIVDQDGANCWVVDGYLKLKVEGSNDEITLLYWKCLDDDKSGYAPTRLKTDIDGEMFVKVGKNFEEYQLTKGTVESKNLYGEKNHDVFFVQARWVIPDKYLGKTLKFIWDVDRDGTARSHQRVSNLTSFEFTVPEAPPVLDVTVTEPVIVPDSVGKILIPWMVGADSVVSAKAVYLDSLNNEHQIVLDNKKSSGMVSLDITQPYRSLYVIVTYKNIYKTLVNVRSSFMDVKMIHAPTDFTDSIYNDSKRSVKLKWNINALNDEDLIEGDAFEIQRSITGNDEDFVTIGMEIFDMEKQSYSYIDSTVIASLTSDMKNEFGFFPTVRYRIRRASTDMWGWHDNPTVASRSVSLDPMRLYHVKSAKMEQAGKDQYTANVTWEYDDDSFYYVWDDRAEMKMKVKMFNRQGALVDCVEYTLTRAEILARHKQLTFTRPCINYHVEVFTSRGTSPIENGIKQIVINSESDWDKFVSYVNFGDGDRFCETQVLLNTDLHLIGSSDRYIVGTEKYPFSGVFDGNGHTIIAEDLTLFKNVKNARISNLNVKYDADIGYYEDISGMVDRAENLVISNCGVEGEFKNFNQAAGFVLKGKDVTITNCLVYAKKLESGKDYPTFAGFINHCENPCTIDNSLFFSAGEGDERFKYIDSNGSNQFAKSFYFRGDCSLQKCYWSTWGEYSWQSYCDETQGEQLPRNQEEWIEIIGNNWQASDNEFGISPILVPENFDANTVIVNVVGATFYYEATGRVAHKLTPSPRQSSVLLQWDVENDVVDYFEVLRRNVGTKKWEVIATNLTDMIYEDTTVSTLDDYEYTVRSAIDCECTSYHYSDSVVAGCKHSCKMEGYVRFADGTGIPNITVTITSKGVSPQVVDSVTTDGTGKFMIENLSYLGRRSIVYNVGVTATDKITLETGQYDITFDDRHNYRELKDFIVTSGHRFTGYVMYDGTSIPVHGVNFSVDGHDVYTSSGKLLETDFDGKFTFYVLDGNRTITAKMDGHTFLDGGKFFHNFTDKLSDIYFYDETKVKMIGRVVGGDKQGNLPLGNSLSRNNLGRDVTMVLTLEGDNTSSIVFDNVNPLLSERDTIYHNGKQGDPTDYVTMVKMYRKRIVVKPDTLTGEYMIELPPVKWKVQQIYCEGYATLFQEGKVSDVVDLTDAIKPIEKKYEGSWVNLVNVTIKDPTVTYNAIYNRIFHNPVELTYKQVGYGLFDYYGDYSYTANNLGGNKTEVPLVYQVAEEINKETHATVMKTKYTFGHPVFSVNRYYSYRLAAVERYYWNNNTLTDTVDVVQMNGGKVVVHNGMVSSLHKEEVDLNEEGIGFVNLYAQQVNYNLTKDDALRTVTMTLELDGKTYEAEPLKAYILNMYTKPGASDILNAEKPTLVDILRDPPGGTSSATLSKGSTLKYTYTMDMAWSVGLTMKLESGSNMNNYYGMQFQAGTGLLGPSYGVIQTAKSDFSYSNEIVFSGKGNRAFTYTMTATDDIKTSSATTMVGANADIYIGVVQNNIVKQGVTIRAIPDSIFQQMKGRLPGATLVTGSVDKAGTMVEIAQGKDADGKLYHLVRDESLIFGAEISSTFAHTQKYITSQLIPELTEQCRALMFIGTPEDAKKQANATGKKVYLSLKNPDDKDFAAANTVNGDDFYYTLAMHQNESTKRDDMNYCVVVPDIFDDTAQLDEVQKYNGIIYEWVKMIIRNEEEKLTAKDLVKNFDVDGGTGMTYGENFESSYSNSSSMTWPLGINVDDYFDSSATGGGVTLTILNVLGKTIGPYVVKILANKMKKGKVEEDWASSETEMQFTGSCFKFLIYPTMSYDVKYNNTTAQTYNRKESFSIGMNNSSHLDFDVYRATSVVGSTKKSNDVLDVFTSQNFYAQVDYNDDYLERHLDLGKGDPVRFARGFVYRTRGGATVQPWEDERKTVFYRSGTVLDARTKKIENPKIALDKQSISGVPYGEPARFKVYLTNDSEEPNAISTPLSFYTLFQEEATNPKGAKLMMDGSPITGDGRNMYVVPGQITEKTLEVYAGEDFDYENLEIGIVSKNDVNVYDKVKFDVHFLHVAGPINISIPNDKWIMNTDAAFHEKKGYFIPVKIDGFDRKQKNFDHIEFQYKESSRGDDYWTNLCSYYDNDSLMALASGVKEKIPTNGYIDTEFYGEGIVMEKAYDLRAVLYIRNGNSFLTSSSKVLSGIKDTRRPQLFGTPEPIDGVLDIGENIVFNFSEAIEHNYLDHKVNFEVKGEVNNDNVVEDISLQFSGNDSKGSIETEVVRNFAGKDLTISMMVKPDVKGVDMPLFSHGTNNKKLQLWITADQKLKAVVDNQREYKSNDTLDYSLFQQVAMVISQPTKDNDPCILTLFIGGKPVGSFEMDEPYTGTGNLIFGRTNEVNRYEKSCKFYQGRMMEARVWYRALTPQQLGTTYGYQRLTGYEMGLVDYYPMNEGEGEYATDKAQGAHARIINAAWAQPQGMSLHLDWNDRGLALDQNAITRADDEDYTLMFWFKTNPEGRGALLCNGLGLATDEGAENQFFIGFEAENLIYRSNGMQVDISGDYSDNSWHHYAMTVNRSHNVGNIYMDRILRATFSVDSLGGISGGFPMLGATYHKTKNDSVVVDTHNWLRGNIDEICLFEQALPLSLIKSYSLKSPYGDEAGLKVYMNFNRQERQKNNDLVLVPYLYSQRIYKDSEGNVRYELDKTTKLPTSTPVRDYIFDESVSKQTLYDHIDQSQGAPVKPYEILRNLNFSHVGRDNQLLINIDEPTEYVNKRNIYVTIRDIPDLNGNSMASPATLSCFVDRNPLRWANKTHKFEIPYGEGMDLDVLIKNISGANHTYEIANLPKWLTVSPRTNTIGPKEELYLTFTVNKNLNVGTYDEVIYLTDEDGLAEPLSLNITVYGEEPGWVVDRNLRRYTMNIVGRVVMGNLDNHQIITDTRDIVGVFDREGVCHGVNHISYDEETGKSMLYLTVYNDTTESKQFYFKLWHYATGKEMILINYDNITFVNSKLYGTKDSPCIFYADNQYVQTLSLEKGWNWVSFNVYESKSFRNLNRLLDGFPWQNGDVLTDNTNGLTLVYTNNHWKLSDDIDSLAISPKNFYAVKVSNDISVQLSGYIVKNKSERTIVVKNGWNSIGYTPMINLPVGTALAEYFNYAKDGDVIKSHDEFAIFNDYNGSGKWEGTLQYMKPGEGYMLLHQDKTTARFAYPFFEPSSTYIETIEKASPKKVRTTHLTTMSLTAMTNGVPMEEGDRLLVYADGELCGASTMTEDSIFYVNIGGDRQQGLSFAIEREGEIIATASDILSFQANAVVGKPSAPTRIDFTRVDIAQEGWYTLQGYKLPGRPSKKGVYIYNGKKKVVK